MRLIYLDPDHRFIQVQLDDGETLGYLTGPIDPPALATVPVDEGNFDYMTIIDEGLTVDPYVAPVYE
jgi:hypothetical protein